MNIKKIKEILEAGYPDDVSEHLIINTISEDEDVVPTIMKILDAERKRKRKLISDMNLELSRAHIGLENPKVNKGHFMDKEILKFYLRNKDQIGHCMKDLRNVELPPEDKEPLGYGL